MRYPLVPVAIAYGFGIVFADRVTLLSGGILAAAFAVTFLAIVWPQARSWLIWPAVFLAGATHMTVETSLSPDDLRHRLRDAPREVVLRGTLIETPYQRVWEREKLEGWKTLAKLQVTSICDKKSQLWAAVSGRVLVTISDLLPPEFFVGQRVEVSGIIRPPKAPVAPGLFDYRNYLHRIGVHYELATQSTNDWMLLSTSTSLPLSDRFHQWAKKMLVRGLPEEDENVHLLWAMTLGWKTALTGEVAEPFMRSGTMHVFAVSGLHITLISLVLFSVFRTVRVPGKYSATCVIILLWFYTYATGMQSSGIRAAIMSSVFVVGYALQRPSNILNSLAAAGFLTVLWDPQQLFQAGFQLSFCVVFFLVLFTRLLSHWRDEILAPDPFLPRQLRRQWKPWIRRPLYYLGDGLIVCLATWLGSAPVIAYYFHIWNPISLLANLLVVPISSAALTCNVATLAGGWLIPSAAELLNYAAWFFMWLMVRLSEWAASLKWGVYYISVPNIWTFIAYYTLIVSVITGWLFRSTSRKWAGTVLAVSGLAWGGIRLHDAPRTMLSALPLQGGSAIYIRDEGRHWLIDCGDQNTARWITKPFLQAQGVNRLSHFVLTHGDIRHVEAALRIHHLFPADHIYLSHVRFKSLPYRKTIEALQQDHAPTKIITAGDHIGPWEVLHPAPNETFPQADDNTIVLLGNVSGKRVLLLSDLGRRGQSALLNRKPGLRADIVITGLPRQGEPVADGFLDVVQPELVIVCDSEYPPAERASEPLRERLGKRNLRVVYTSDSGAVTLAFRKHAYTLQATRKTD
jgi:competence protein ComEC